MISFLVLYWIQLMISSWVLYWIQLISLWFYIESNWYRFGAIFIPTDIILGSVLNPKDDIILGAISNTVRGPFLKRFCPAQRCFWGFEFSPSYALKGHIAHSCKATEAVSLNRMEEAWTTTEHPAEIPEFSNTDIELASVHYPVVPTAYMPALELFALYFNDIPGSPEDSANPILIKLFVICQVMRCISAFCPRCTCLGRYFITIWQLQWGRS